MATDDQVLIKQIVHRDQQAFLALYERYSSRVYTLIQHMIDDQMAAEEILQETFLRLWRRAGQYEPERGSVLIWLLTIARYTALERLRFESHRPILSYGNEPSPILENIPEPESTSEEARWRSLHLAVESLPEEQKSVIELAYFQGMSQSEIAEQLELPLGTVKTRLRTGMIRLRHQWLEMESS